MSPPCGGGGGGVGLRASMTLRAMTAGTLCSWWGLPSRTGRKREARVRETGPPRMGVLRMGW